MCYYLGTGEWIDWEESRGRCCCFGLSLSFSLFGFLLLRDLVEHLLCLAWQIKAKCTLYALCSGTVWYRGLVWLIDAFSISMLFDYF